MTWRELADAHSMELMVSQRYVVTKKLAAASPRATTSEKSPVLVSRVALTRGAFGVGEGSGNPSQFDDIVRNLAGQTG